MKEFNSEYVKGYNECLEEIKEILNNIDDGNDYTDQWYNMGTAIDKIMAMPSKINATVKIQEGK